MIQRIRNGRTDLVIDHLAAGHPADAVDEQGVSLIQWCAYYGDLSAVRQLLLQGESLDSLGPNFDLNGAAFHGHWRLCEFLLESGADPNCPLADTGETPLHSALCAPHRPAYELVVRVLLAHQADPNRATIPGMETGCFMRDCRTRGETPLHRAAAFADESVVRQLLDAGARIDARDTHGDSPLSWASWHLRPDGVLRALCFGDFRLHPDRRSTGDHGRGWRTMEVALLGNPHPDPATGKGP